MAVALLMSGCGSFRGLPTHGGGKRFDEEERVVAGAIRQAVATMDLKELRNKKVRVVVSLIEHSGSGSVTFPGPSSIGAGISGNRTLYNNARDIYREFGEYPGEDTWRPQYRDDNMIDSLSSSGNLQYELATRYLPAADRTDRDGAYLSDVVDMKIRHLGGRVVGVEAEITLIVLVDVLGTNLSRDEYFVCRQDRLIGSCELTYYALDPLHDEQVIFPARRTAARAAYTEGSLLGLSGIRIRRTLESVAPYPLPVDSASAMRANGRATGPENRFASPADESATFDSNAVGKLVETIRTLIELREAAKARILLDFLRARSPQHPELNQLSAEITAINGMPPTAAADKPEQTPDHAEKLKKKTVDNLLNLIDAQIQLQMTGEARQTLEMLRSMDPSNPGLNRLEVKMQR